MEQPLQATTGRRWKDHEAGVRDLVTDYVGMRRSDKGMREAQRLLASLAADEAGLEASSFHKLMRTLKAKNIRLAAEVMTEAALHRTESRSGAARRRLDHPETDDVTWKRSIVVSRAPEGGVRMDYMSKKELPDAAAMGGRG